MNRPFSWLAALAIVFNSFVWGLSWFPLQLLQSHGLHPLWSTAMLYAPPVLVVMWLRGALLWRDYRQHRLLWGLLLAAGLTSSCFNWAVATGDVIRVVLLFYLMPVWSVFIAWWLLGERPRLPAMLRVALALLGVALVMQPPSAQLLQPRTWQWPAVQSLPDVLAIAGGVFFATINVLLRKTAGNVHNISRTWSMFAGGFFLGGGCAWLASHWGVAGIPPLPQLGGWVWLVLAFCGMFVAANTALGYGSQHLDAHTMSLLMVMEVVFASASSAWAGAASIHPHTLAGGVLVVAAALLAAVGHGAQELAQEAGVE